MKRRQNNEAQLEKELGRFFRKLKKEVLKELNEYWSDYQLLQGQVNLMLSPVHEAHKEYYEIIRKYKLREYELGKAEAKRLIKRANKDKVALKAATTLSIQGFIDKDKNSLFGTIPKAEEDLLNRTFRTSQNTLNRVDNQLNQIISEGYREGKGINQVANDITQRFDQLADWEARRIARTEINTSHNQATRDQYKEDGVEYTQWIAANDDRTRDSHAEVDGEIIPIDGKYSNGLSFPGDTSGPIEEWINCRCSNAPFVIPYGFMAPSFSPFRESDLVPINTETLAEPTPEQLEANLTQAQRSQYEQYTKAVNEAQAVIDSKFSLPRERLQARTQLEYNLSRLNQLKLVANGELTTGLTRVIGTSVSTTQEPTESTTNRTTLTEQTSTALGPYLTEGELKRYNHLKELLVKDRQNLERVPKDNPRRLMYEARIKSHEKNIQKLEQKSHTKPEKKAGYYTMVETPKEVLNFKEEIDAKKAYSQVAKNKQTYDVFEFEGFSIAMDRELGLRNKNLVSVKEIRDHVRSLPENMRNSNIRINVSNIFNPEAMGLYYQPHHEVEIFNDGIRVRNFKNKVLIQESITILDVITHELAHGVDLKNYDSLEGKGNLATINTWGRLCKEDNKRYRYRNPSTGRMRTPNTFPTQYAGEAWYKQKRIDRRVQYQEDFAESSLLYLSPLYHNKFIEMFPNRAKFLKELYGEPNFKNSIIPKLYE